MKTRMTTNSMPFRALALCAALAVSAHAQTVWQGAGAGGSGATSSNWNDGANWTAGVPTNVNVKIDFSSAGQVIVNQAGLTNAGFVTVTNADGETPTKSLRISQDITFDGIEITPGSSSRYGLRIDGSRVLTLSGNGAVLRVNADTATKAQQVQAVNATLRFTGTNLVLGAGLAAGLQIVPATGSGATVDFAASNATVNMSGRQITMGSQNGTIRVNGGQTWVSNSAGFEFTQSVSVTNTGTAPLNWAPASVRWAWSASGSNALFLPGGSYDALALDIAGANANKAILNLVGDVTAGGTAFGGLRLYNNSATGTSVVSLASSTLQVTNAGSGIRVGYSGSGAGILDIGSGKLATVSSVLLGEGGSTGNAILLGSGGRLQVTNASASGLLELRKGTMVMTSNSSVTVDKLLVGGAQGFLQFNGGTLAARSAGVSNGTQFVVGDGSSAATYQMVGFGSHSFTNGLRLSSNASLKGSGMIRGDVSGATGAVAQIGNSPGVVTNFGSWDNRGITLNLEIGNVSNLVLTPGGNYDLLAVTGAWTHGGSIVVDLANFTRPVTASNLALITWNAALGSSLDTSVSFLNGSPLSWEFTSTSFIVTIPEPSAFFAIALGAGALAFLRRNRSL